MIKQILNLVKKAEFVDLEKLNPFQPDNLKIMTSDSFSRLKESILLNNFVTGFYVWDDGEKIWIIDGHHRKYALQELKEEGVIIPDQFLCLFLDLEDKKQAAQALLTYASNHAKVHPEGFMEYCHAYNLDLNLIDKTLDIPGLNIQKLDGDMLDMKEDQSISEEKKLSITVDCKNQSEQRELFIELESRGFTCKLIM